MSLKVLIEANMATILMLLLIHTILRTLNTLNLGKNIVYTYLALPFLDRVGIGRIYGWVPVPARKKPSSLKSSRIYRILRELDPQKCTLKTSTMH